jgi:hypothetical protein
MAEERVLTVTVFRSGKGFLARTEAAWTFEDAQRSWNPPGLDRAETAIAAAELALAWVKRIGTHRKRGRKPSGYKVARQLAMTPYVPPTK